MLTEVERRLKTKAAKALAAALGESADDAGYVSEWRRNLVSGLTSENIERVQTEFSKGKGAEIAGVRPKFCASYSSSALAANTFARWRNDVADLAHMTLGSITGFDNLQLERACHSGLQGTPPHLDVVLTGASGVVGIESKCLETLSEHRASFRDVYRKRFEELAHDSWRDRFCELSANPDSYRFLDAAQLLKHYLGLKNTFPDAQTIVLMYVWWEPSNAGLLPIFGEHHAEVASFANGLADPRSRSTPRPIRSSGAVGSNSRSQGGSMSMSATCARDTS